MSQPAAKATFSRDIKTRIRRRAHALSLLKYERLVILIERDLATKRITPEQVDAWTDADAEISAGSSPA